MTDENIVICMTTISQRISSLPAIIHSLLMQDFTDFTIRIYVSREAYLLDDGISDVPDNCLNFPEKVSFHWVPNIGPYRKIIPALLDETLGDAIIVTADDDTLYPPDWLSALLDHHSRFGGIVAHRGHFMHRDQGSFRPYRRWMTMGHMANPSLYNLPTGKDGVLYRRSFFTSQVKDMDTALKIAPTTDDLWLKWHSAIACVPVYLINANYTTNTFLVAETEGDNLYGRYNRDGGNNRSIALLEAYAKDIFGIELAVHDDESLKKASAAATIDVFSK